MWNVSQLDIKSQCVCTHVQLLPHALAAVLTRSIINEIALLTYHRVACTHYRSRSINLRGYVASCGGDRSPGVLSICGLVSLCGLYKAYTSRPRVSQSCGAAAAAR